MIVAECPKIFDVQCIWGRIFVSLEKIFVFQVLVDYISFSFNVKYIRKKLQEIFWAHFLGAHTVKTVPKYIWMRHCEL